MRVRVKFSKNGSMKYIGHLDVMRYFQKVLRRADIDVAFSEGFSPHMIMSFAAPLGVGITSDGEYFDLDLKSWTGSEDMISRMNAQMAEGFSVLSVQQIPEEKSFKAMTQVAAAAYVVAPDTDLMSIITIMAMQTGRDLKTLVSDFMKQEDISILRKTKRSEEVVNIRPWIYHMDYSGGRFYLMLSQGSVHNLKPELAVQAFCRSLQVDARKELLRIHRSEIYTNIGTEERIRLVPLSEVHV